MNNILTVKIGDTIPPELLYYTCCAYGYIRFSYDNVPIFMIFNHASEIIKIMEGTEYNIIEITLDPKKFSKTDYPLKPIYLDQNCELKDLSFYTYEYSGWTLLIKNLDHHFMIIYMWGDTILCCCSDEKMINITNGLSFYDNFVNYLRKYKMKSAKTMIY